MKMLCSAPAFPRSTHWYANEFGPLSPGTNLVGPGLLEAVWLPMFVLRTRNSTGAPETSALTFTAMGKIEIGWSLNPGTGAHCVEDVDTAEVCHVVSMQLTGVLPLPVLAMTAHVTPTTSARVVVTITTFRIATSFQGPIRRTL